MGEQQHNELPGPVLAVSPSLLRRFALVRRHDPTEVSGVGVVAEGVEYADNHMCALFWRNSASGGIYQDIDVIREKHCHHGYTDLVWIDPEPGNSTMMTMSISVTTGDVTNV